jgi:hypothetical protein
LKNVFDEKPVNTEVLDSMITLSKELLKIESKIEYLESTSEDLLEKYKLLFSVKTPNVDEIDEYISQVSHSNTNSYPKWFYIALSSALIVLLGSIGFYFVNIFLGLTFSIASILATITLLLVFPKDTVDKNTTHIKDFLSEYGYTNTNYLENLLALKAEISVYEKLLSSEIEKSTQLQELYSSKEKITNAIVPYLQNFYDDINDEYSVLLESIKNDCNEYNNLSIQLDKQSIVVR